MTGVLEALMGMRPGWQTDVLIAALTRSTILIVACGTLALLLRTRGLRGLPALWVTALLLTLVTPFVSPAGPARIVSLGLDSPPTPGLAAWIFLVWAAGTLISIVRMKIASNRLRMIARDARPVTDARICGIAGRAAAAVGVARIPVIVCADRFAMPVTFGARRAVIILPRAASSWDTERLDIVLRHELSHVLRSDWVWQVVAQACCAVSWFNPLVWLAHRRLRVAAELACDQHVLDSGLEPVRYAGELIAIARACCERPGLRGAIPFLRGSDIDMRIEALLSTRGHKPAPSPILTAAACIALVILGTTLLAVAPAVAPCAPSTIAADG